MASSQFFALFDDIATLLDDVAAMTKVATKKTAGVLGDDLALNAEQVSGVHADRELPVVWAVFKGSLLNKVILVPSALIISAVAPWAITPLLLIGGAFLCFEGAEKILHLFEKPKPNEKTIIEKVQLAKTEAEILEIEKDKIKGAIRTDFILSAEIVVISLGVAAQQALLNKALVLTTIALLMTFGVYGLVAVIVKLDDLGLWLHRKKSAFQAAIGRALLFVAPKLMKSLSWIGMLAMFLVGGGILVHGMPPLHHWVESVQTAKVLVENGINFAVGLAAGLALAASFNFIQSQRLKT